MDAESEKEKNLDCMPHMTLVFSQRGCPNFVLMSKTRVGSIQPTGVTTMNLVALHQEDLRDTSENVGLEYLDLLVRYNILYETSAAYAGYNYCLYSH